MMGEKEMLKKQLKALKEKQELDKLKSEVKALKAKNYKAKKYGKKALDFLRPRGNEAEAMKNLMGY